MKLVNLTPHEIKIVTAGGTVVVPPSGRVARVSTESEAIGTVDVEGVPVELCVSRFTGLQDLPSPQPGTLYIVSALVQQACMNRNDLYSPGNLIRDEKGQVIGCSRLERFAYVPLPNLAGTASQPDK